QIVDGSEIRKFGADFLRCPARDLHFENTYGMNYAGRDTHGPRGPWYLVNGSSPNRNLGYKLVKCKNTWFLLADTWGVVTFTSSAGQILTPSPSYGWPVNVDYDQDGVLDTYAPQMANYGPHNG